MPTPLTALRAPLLCVLTLLAPLNQGPPLPNPGQTVHWTTAMSPICISQSTTIVAGGTVIVDPGVTVSITSAGSLTVRGTLSALGVVGQRIIFQGAGNLIVTGSLQMDRASVRLDVEGSEGGFLDFLRTNFTSAATLQTLTAFSIAPVLVLDQCSFTSSLFLPEEAVVRMTNTSFSRTFVSILQSFVFLDNLTFDQSPGDGLNLVDSLQPVLLDNLTVTGSSAAAINLAAVNAQVGSNVALSGNKFPMQLGGGGVLPGSILPSTGNTKNYINVADAFIAVGGSGSPWADAGIPYVVASSYNANRLRILPGARVQLGDMVAIFGDNQDVDARGSPANPVIFQRFRAALQWQGLQFFHRFENCRITGGQIGARFHSISGPGFIDNCLIQNCDFGTQNNVVVRKTQFLNNATGSWNDTWPNSLNGAKGANSFIGNTTAVDSGSGTVNARNNWWNRTNGPVPSDTIGNVLTTPFRSMAPDFNDNPPIVHLNHTAKLLEPGSKVILTWTSVDDVSVASHRIEFDDPRNGTNTTVVASGLPGTQHAFEWTVPNIGFIVSGKVPSIRVVAIDSAGQEGWDASKHLIPSGRIQGTLTITTDLSGPFLAGEHSAQLCWNSNNLPSIQPSFVFDADLMEEPLGGGFGNCSAQPTLNVPFVSTDTARIRLTAQGSRNDVQVFFSAPFQVRPDARFGDAPPSVTMLTPMAGDSFPSEGAVPITWTASDDEALSAFQVQATYDQGHTWHFIAEDLPGTARSFTFPLPPTTGIADVRVRVIAVDLRFQNSSSGADRPFSIGTPPGPWTDLGNSLPGTNGAPALDATGSLVQGTTFMLHLTSARAQAPAFLGAGFSAVNRPFHGGVLVPKPQKVVSRTVSAAGTVDITASVPAKLTTGRKLFVQFWIQDPNGPAGWAASNALKGTAP